MFLLVLPAALATTDDLGGDGTETAEAGMMKLVSVEVAEAAVVTELAFAVEGTSEEEVVLALYQRDDRGYRLLYWLDADAIVGGFATSGPVRWLLEPGEIYALGAYVGNGHTCFYDEGESASPWFGEVVEGYQVDQVVPDTFRGEGEPLFYRMRVVSEDADFDGDGVISTIWGGGDCDDSDPDVIDPTAEVPYDGVDQDCDGSDLVDLDRDGAAAVEAGGPDCDDSTGAIGPTAIDVCGDGLDSDCSGADASCAEEAEPDEPPALDEGVDVVGECGCAVDAPAPGLLGALLGLALARRRRRP